MYFSERIIVLRQDAADREAALRRLAGEFLGKGLVAETFPQAVLDREQRYPTGLGLGELGVAIPHTDPEHVLRPQLGFMSLATPVRFRQMGDESATADVSLIIMLALHESEDQLPMLQQLMGLFQDRSSLDSLVAATAADQVVEVFAGAGIH